MTATNPNPCEDVLALGPAGVRLRALADALFVYEDSRRHAWPDEQVRQHYADTVCALQNLARTLHALQLSPIRELTHHTQA